MLNSMHHPGQCETTPCERMSQQKIQNPTTRLSRLSASLTATWLCNIISEIIQSILFKKKMEQNNQPLTGHSCSSTAPSSTLTEKQLQLIEQKRITAIQLRQQKLEAETSTRTTNNDKGENKSTTVDVKKRMDIDRGRESLPLPIVPSLKVSLNPNPYSSTKPTPFAATKSNQATTSATKPFPIFNSVASSSKQTTEFSLDPVPSNKPPKSSSFAPSLSKPMWVNVPGFSRKGKKQDKPYERKESSSATISSTSSSSSKQTSCKNNAIPTGNIKPAVGSATLIERNRFQINMTYSLQAINIFRTTPESQYDAVKKCWSFPLTQHNRLMASIETLKPWVILEGLPNFVLKGLKNYHPAMLSPEPGIESIHPVLLEALMPFQKDGVIFGIKKHGRVLIADDMGLGKTIQALGIAHFYWNEWPLLIITPSSVRYCWKQAILQWIPSVDEDMILMIHTGKQPVPNIKKKDDKDDNTIKVVIISYDLIQKRRLEFEGYKVIIADESHYLKNATSGRTTACLPLLQDATRVILLSGTPALSRPIELFSQICAVKPKMFTHKQFVERYCGDRKTAYGRDYSGASNMLELNILLREHIMIRRLKIDVLHQLPSKTRKIVHLQPRDERNDFQNALKTSLQFQNVVRSDSMTEKEKLNKIQQFYTESASIKLGSVREYIKEKVGEKRKFIVFAHHKIMLDGICKEIEESKVNYIRIDGSTSPQDKEFCINQFQTQQNIRVAVLSILTANSGITLTAADLVIFAELYWNPGIITQAEDRVHRIGQQNSVTIEYLLANDTADVAIWPMVQTKLGVLNQIGLSENNFAIDAIELTSSTKNTTMDHNDDGDNGDEFDQMTPTGDALLMQIEM